MVHGRDQIADASGAELARLARLYDFPDCVKQAELAELLSPRPRAESVYADPVRRQYPCDSPAATYLSALFFQEKAAEFHPKTRDLIRTRLDKAAAYHGVAGHVEGMRATWEGHHKTAAARRPDGDYAFVWVADSGHKERRLPLTTAAETREAADWLAEYRDALPFADRHAIARKVLEKAAAFGADLGPHRDALEAQAGLGVGDLTKIAALVRGRAYLAKDPALADSFRKMATTIERAPRTTLHPENLVKLAETLDQLDRSLGLAGKYTPALPRPEDVLFAATFTKAASADQGTVALTSGRAYTRDQLKKLALDDLRDLFGDEFADRVGSGLGVDVEKLAEEVATLPLPDARTLDALLSEQGVSPVFAKAASAAERLTAEQYRALAAQYAP